MTAQKHNLGYLSAKEGENAGTCLISEPVLDGSYCIWNHEGDVLPQPVSPQGLKRGPLSDLVDERELKAERRPEVKDVEKSMDEL